MTKQVLVHQAKNYFHSQKSYLYLQNVFSVSFIKYFLWTFAQGLCLHLTSLDTRNNLQKCVNQSKTKNRDVVQCTGRDNAEREDNLKSM